MKKIFDTTAAALLGAWKKQMDIPLPRFLRDVSGNPGNMECAAFPLLGWLCGAAAVIPGILTAAILSPVIGAFVYAICAWLLLTFRDSARSDGMIANALARTLPGDAIPWRIAVPVLLTIIKFLLLMAVFRCGNAWHLPLVIGAVFTVETVLTLDGNFLPPLLNDTPESRRNMWITAGILLFISFLFCRLPAALSALSFVIVWRIFQVRTIANGGTTLAEVSFAGGITGWLTLISGVLTI